MVKFFERRREVVGIEDPGNASRVGERVVQSFQAESGFHGVRDHPTEDFARIPVHHGTQVSVPARHGHIGDIGAPNLIRALHSEVL